MSEIHAAVGAYVTNALDGEELAAFREHLAGCETCRREVLEFRETASELSALTATPPPPALKASVLAAIGEVRVLPPEGTEAGAGPAAGAVPPRRVAPAVDELALRRQRRLTRVLSVAVAAMTVVALGLGAWVVTLVQREPPAATATREAELLQAPDLRTYTVELKDGGQATFLVSRSLDRALLSGRDLPALPSGRTYQLWTLGGPLAAPTRVTPDALAGGGGSTTVWFTGPVGTSDALAISVEDAGGATAPTDIQGATAL